MLRRLVPTAAIVLAVGWWGLPARAASIGVAPSRVVLAVSAPGSTSTAQVVSIIRDGPGPVRFLPSVQAASFLGQAWRVESGHAPAVPIAVRALQPSARRGTPARFAVTASWPSGTPAGEYPAEVLFRPASTLVSRSSALSVQLAIGVRVLVVLGAPAQSRLRFVGRPLPWVAWRSSTTWSARVQNVGQGVGQPVAALTLGGRPSAQAQAGFDPPRGIARLAFSASNLPPLGWLPVALTLSDGGTGAPEQIWRGHLLVLPAADLGAAAGLTVLLEVLRAGRRLWPRAIRRP